MIKQHVFLFITTPKIGTDYFPNSSNRLVCLVALDSVLCEVGTDLDECQSAE